MMKDTWFEPPAEWFAEDQEVAEHYLDACPECMTRDVTPHGTHLVDGGILAYYRCHCGADWRCSWSKDAGVGDVA